MVLGFSSTTALGQGGTGRAPTNGSTNKPAPRVKKRATVSAGTSNRAESPDLEDRYVPTGPTAESFIFLRDFLNAYGYESLSDEKKKDYVYKKSRFIPVNQCTAIILNEQKFTSGELDQQVYTFSFSDIDPSQLTGWRVSKVTTKDGESYNSPIFLSTPNNRPAIKHIQGYNHGHWEDYGNGPIVLFVISDNSQRENQVRVINALKSATELCGGKPSKF